VHILNAGETHAHTNTHLFIVLLLFKHVLLHHHRAPAITGTAYMLLCFEGHFDTVGGMAQASTDQTNTIQLWGSVSDIVDAKILKKRKENGMLTNTS
jgi:hypothetical protein